jgi:hypothetical protein
MNNLVKTSVDKAFMSCQVDMKANTIHQSPTDESTDPQQLTTNKQKLQRRHMRWVDTHFEIQYRTMQTLTT